ncbi:hypothetical protein DPMN_172192 [Dreissena polymorpha]|uniref:Uncharacterized protein n=1 Tax=Dreissena polymorpha TaxID=45954 RepID=A0A9D4E2H2_DREPO|nr:hypothetical protein DPMN_172192 [Dreissena polymorpha]
MTEECYITGFLNYVPKLANTAPARHIPLLVIALHTPIAHTVTERHIPLLVIVLHNPIANTVQERHIPLS